MNKSMCLFLPFALIILFSSNGYSKTLINAASTDTSPAAQGIDLSGTTEIARQVQDIFDNFGPAVANAYGMANISGYPVGSAYLGSFPSFFIGVSVNVGLTNMQYFDDSVPKKEGVYPAFAFNPVLYFGLGLGKGLDFLGKLMTYSNGFYDINRHIRERTDLVELNKFNVYTIGGKVRYNTISEKTLLPGIFKLGGVTLSGGVDFMYGTIKISGSDTLELTSIDIDTSAGAYEDASYTQTVDLNFDPRYAIEVGWWNVSVNLQALTYFHILWVFGIYGGVGLTVNYGSFSFKMNGSGDVFTQNEFYRAIQYMQGREPDGNMGNLNASTDNGYTPYFFMPIFIIGFDFNLIIARFTFESMVNLRNRRDVNLQLGTRIQW